MYVQGDSNEIIFPEYDDLKKSLGTINTVKIIGQN